MEKIRCRYILPVILFALLSPSISHGQGAFQNLNFESAIIMPVPGDEYGRVEFGPALPGWNGYVGLVPQTLALYNNLFIGSPGIGLVGPASGGIAGGFSLVLQGGSPLNSPNVSIVQSGLIPAGAKSVEFQTWNYAVPFSVSMNGEPISLTILRTMNNVVTYGGDVSQFAGQSAELQITAFSGLPRSGNLYLDSISFSPLAVPEPSTYALLGLGGLLLGLGRWRSFRAK